MKLLPLDTTLKNDEDREKLLLVRGPASIAIPTQSSYNRHTFWVNKWKQCVELWGNSCSLSTLINIIRLKWVLIFCPNGTIAEIWAWAFSVHLHAPCAWIFSRSVYKGWAIVCTYDPFKNSTNGTLIPAVFLPSPYEDRFQSSWRKFCFEASIAGNPLRRMTLSSAWNPTRIGPSSFPLIQLPLLMC